MKKGKAESIFTQSGRATFYWAFSSSGKGKESAKKKNDLSNAMLPCVLICTRILGEPVIGQLTNVNCDE